MPNAELLTEIRDGVGYLTLNRPRAINALSVEMMAGMSAVLTAWASDPAVARVELSGAGERGLCAGADVRVLRDIVLSGGDYGEFFDIEYALDLLIATYPKPYVAHQRGITMGGGLGISAHGSRRIAYPDTKFAMPETIIGFTPDVGVAWILAHAPGQVGTHVALTGTSVGASDGVWLGLADEVHGDAAPGVLAENRDWIDDCYAFDDAARVVAALEKHPNPRARAAATQLRQRSPLSVAVTLAALRRVPAMSGVADVLEQDRRLARHLIGGPDFAEGVRAQLVDKDKRPQWTHARIEDVTLGEVEACFR